MVVEEIRDFGLIAGSRWGKRGFDLCCKIDYDNPRDRIDYFRLLKSWKLRSRKRCQWMPSAQWRIDWTCCEDPCSHPHWRKPNNIYKN